MTLCFRILLIRDPTDLLPCGTLFQQTRTESPMDGNMQNALSILEELVTERGVFQYQIHFSSGQAAIWTVDDPLCYRILDHEVRKDPDICYMRRGRTPRMPAYRGRDSPDSGRHAASAQGRYDHVPAYGVHQHFQRNGKPDLFPRRIALHAPRRIPRQGHRILVRSTHGTRQAAGA